MSNYDFTYAERKFIKRFIINDSFKLIHWKEYGSTEWYTRITRLPYIGDEIDPNITKTTAAERRVIRMMLKFGLILPEIESDKEYSAQRALGLVIGRIYYMPEKIQEELKNEAIDL